MAILNYTTNIDFEKTIGEISKCLRDHDADKVIVDYENKLPVAVTFCLTINGNTVGFRLPSNHTGVLKAMQNNRKVPRNKCTPEQAMRVSWRIVKDWVAAQLAIVEAQIADVAEVFLPYAVTKDGTTLYNQIKQNGMPLIGMGS